MKNLIGAITFIPVFLFSFNTAIPGIPPRFQLRATNFNTVPTSGQDSILDFDVWINQTNYGQPGVEPFEYCSGRFVWTFNREAIGPPGAQYTLTFLNSFLPPELWPAITQIDTINNYLIAFSNVPSSGINYFIPALFPGSHIGTFRLTTSANHFERTMLNMNFEKSGVNG